MKKPDLRGASHDLRVFEGRYEVGSYYTSEPMTYKPYKPYNAMTAADCADYHAPDGLVHRVKVYYTQGNTALINYMGQDELVALEDLELI
jgi:hypothetical protein